jgi:hypothetical protein
VFVGDEEEEGKGGGGEMGRWREEMYEVASRW